MDDYAERWRLPDARTIYAQWQSDLATIGDGCSCPGGYHRVWSLIKLAGRHLGLFKDAELIRSLAGPLLSSPARVLIAGSADHFGLRMLADIGEAGGPHRFTLTDLCDAPLRLVRAEADRSGLDLRTVRQSICDPLPMTEPADLIFGHYVLNFLDLPLLRSAFASLKAALAPGGTMIFAQRSALGLQQLDAEPWVALTTRRLAQILPQDYRHWSLIDEVLRTYAHHRGNRALLPFAEFEAAVADSGLAIRDIRQTGREKTLSAEHRADIIDERANVYVLGHG